MLPLVLSSQLVVGGVLLAFGLLHFLIGMRHPERKLHLTFSVTAFIAMAEAFIAGWRYHPSSPEDFILASKCFAVAQFAFGLSVVWFVAYYRGAPDFRWPQLLVLPTLTIIALQAFLPYGLLFNAQPSLTNAQMPWGETIVIPSGHPTRLLFLAHLTSAAMVFFVLWVCYRLWKDGAREKSAALAIAFMPLFLVAWPYGLLVNRGVLLPPYLYSYAFIAMIGLMSFRMVKDTVRLASLALAVETHSRRWTMLLENIELHVVGCGRSGVIEYVNPPFCVLTGYKKEEVIGLHYTEFLAKDQLEVAARQFQRILDGLPVEDPSLRIRRKDGNWRTVLWTSVAAFDEEGAVNGILNIGFDITDKELAEKARDEAIRKLEELASRLEGENLYLREEIGAGEGSHRIVGESPAIRYVVNQVKMVARTKATVLVEGETGVGKELVARAVHDMSDRSGGPFIGLNCAAIAPTLVEAELFGAEKGAYTGSDRQRKGRFELADGGTLFLDEVGELSLDNQAKLLRVLQEGEFQRVGGQMTQRVDVRIIAATNRNLHTEIAAGRFREDLYYRLGVYPITVPPLRQRREDIPLLVEHLVGKVAARHGKVITEVPSHAMRLLAEWDWPGNIRELANVIERAVILSSGPVLALPPGFGRPAALTPAKAARFLPLTEFERNYVRDVLDHTDWKIYGPGGAAEILDIHPNTLRSRLAKMGLTKKAAAN